MEREKHTDSHMSASRTPFFLDLNMCQESIQSTAEVPASIRKNSPDDL